ncbi:ribonuclease T2 [Auriculariales sp. MPI-PUGE-AT-0066]|nr:ribonuclease T2 [Auriculariales sp. MPI-PUGE-AT-0066]
MFFAVVLAAAATGALASPSSPVLSSTSPDLLQCLLSPPSFSCENKTDVNTCCLPTQGLVLQTQFWDTYTGYEQDGQLLPKDSWTIHGLWPDNCDGSYESYCDLSRQYDPAPSPATVNNVTVPPYTGPSVANWINQFGRKDLLDYMNKYWIAQNQPNWWLWAHEYSKHATCFTTFDTKCYGKNYKEHEELINYYDTTIQAFKQYPTFKWLAKKGIIPSNSTTYTRDQILGALEAATGVTPYIGCSKTGAFQEVWYYSHSFGAPQLGIFKQLNTTSTSNCPETGISYFQRSVGSEHILH